MIAVENLVKDYGAFRAVDGVTFSVSPGEVLGFLGPNGAGKSTTMKILSGYLPATAGKATVSGYDVATQSLDVRHSLGYLAEHNALYTDMMVSEYLRYIGAMRGLPRRGLRGRVDGVVEACDLQEYYYRPIGTLSKGFRQRVGLAAAMIHDPQVLILDEPTSGLDPIEIKKIRELIRLLGKEKTVILSTHILQEVEATCDRAIIIARGRIIADGTPEGIRRRNSDSHRLRVSLVGEGDLASWLGALPGVNGVNELPTDGARRRYELTADPGATIEPELTKLALAKKLEICELVSLAASLEEAFANLVLAAREERDARGAGQAVYAGDAVAATDVADEEAQS